MSTPTTKAQTLFSFCTRFEKSRTSLEKLKIDYIFVDEISMMHEHMYKFLIMLKQIRPDIKLILSGNFDQLEPVNDRAKFDYKNSPALFELADGQILKLTKCQRQKNEEFFNMIHPNNIVNLTKANFNNSSNTNKHLAFTNAKRMEINKIMMAKFIKSKKLSMTSNRVLHLSKNSHDGNSQDVYLTKGMPIISKANNKKYEIANNDTFIIDSISVSKEDGLQYIYISPEDADTTQPISMNDFQKLFRVAFCITVHSSQGATFDEPYTCHEFDRYSDKMKYTALSRTTEKNYINIL
jgi:ATP-dependent exoDNAse (exonuclease V) alpha subunit